jgi:hypothetical protein
MRAYLIILLLTVCTTFLYGQEKFLVGANNVKTKKIISKITIDNNFIDTFSFINQWDYPAYTIKNDRGHFSIDEDREMTPQDTAHLYFTAKCKTNVQGGYDVRYSYAKIDKGELVLTFVDGAPAYNSEFYVHINDTNFWCDVETVYPLTYSNEKKSCTITKQALIIDRANYSLGDTIKGFIEIEFIETVTVPKKGTQKSKLFLKGYFKTPIIEAQKNTAAN